MDREQRTYDVTFKTLERNPVTRTVRVKCVDSVHASMVVYQTFGRKKIKVISAKVIKEDVKEDGKTD